LIYVNCKKFKVTKWLRFLNSVPNEVYTCPVCGEVLTRNYGLQKQYFSHPKDVDNTSCELKMGLMLKNDPTIFDENEEDILHREYYNKEFPNY